MAVVSIFNSVNLGTPNFNVAFANSIVMTLQQGVNLAINGRTYADVFEIDFVAGGLKYQDLLAGSGLSVSGSNVLTAGTVTGLIENVSDGTNWSPNWMIQDITSPASTVFQAYQTPSNTDDISMLAAALKGGDVISGSTLGPDSIFAGDGNDLIFVGGTGGNTIDGGAGTDTVVYAGALTDHQITRSANGSIKVSGSGSATTSADVLTNVETIQFSDYTVTTNMSAKAATLSAATINNLVDLYVAYFNRVPEASGLSYWIDQVAAGKSLTQVSKDFYSAGLQFSAITGYSATQSNTDFITTVYKYVLGRSDAAGNGPTSSDIAYWNGQITSGAVSKDGLIARFLSDARTFSGDPTWGWVTTLLNNKDSFGIYHAITLGLDYASPDQAIAQTVALVGLITPTSTDAAVKALGLDALIHL